MKTITRLLIVATTVTVLVGCASGWATRNDPVTFIPGVLNSTRIARVGH